VFKAPSWGFRVVPGLGIILLLIWLRDRSNLALYIGVFVTALALSDLLNGAGWSTATVGDALPGRRRAVDRPGADQVGQELGLAAILGALLCLSGAAAWRRAI